MKSERVPMSNLESTTVAKSSGWNDALMVVLLGLTLASNAQAGVSLKVAATPDTNFAGDRKSVV